MPIIIIIIIIEMEEQYNTFSNDIIIILHEHVRIRRLWYNRYAYYCSDCDFKNFSHANDLFE